MSGLLDRIAWVSPEQLAREIAIAAGFDQQRAATLLDDLNRAALFRESNGDASHRLRIRAVRKELGV